MAVGLEGEAQEAAVSRRREQHDLGQLGPQQGAGLLQEGPGHALGARRRRHQAAELVQDAEAGVALAHGGVGLVRPQQDQGHGQQQPGRLLVVPEQGDGDQGQAGVHGGGDDAGGQELGPRERVGLLPPHHVEQGRHGRPHQVGHQDPAEGGGPVHGSQPEGGQDGGPEHGHGQARLQAEQAEVEGGAQRGGAAVHDQGQSRPQEAGQEQVGGIDEEQPQGQGDVA